MNHLIQLYQDRISGFQEKAAALQKRYDQLSFVRLAIFLAALGIGFWLGTIHILAVVAWVVVFLLGFYRFVRYHQALLFQAKIANYKVALNDWEKNAQVKEYAQFKDGAAYLDPNHPYAVDLDIFGPYSLFQYINRTSTIIGADRLASYLKEPASRKEITERQQAITSIGPDIDWRQNLQALGGLVEDDPAHLQMLKLWIGKPSYLLPKKLLLVARWLIPVWSIVFLIFIAPYFPWYITLLCLLPAGLMLRFTLEAITQIHEQTGKAGELLEKYGKLIEHIELASFESPMLQRLQREFSQEKLKASIALKKLAYIISQLNLRYNPFALLFNLFFLWDFHWIYRLEKWKEAHGPNIEKWFEALAEIEALNSMGTLVFNHPDWSMPEQEDALVFKAESIGHPLLPTENRVDNDFEMPLSGHLKLITGSNMAGKSTFLRTIGINMVLAMSGAPVCAKSLKMPPIQVYTSMRTTDALHESTSSFFAELKRLKFIIEAVEHPPQQGPWPFFILDEILKGTNSRDRHTGGKALIRQLIAAKGGGLIATHDLELGAMMENYPDAIENLCMEVEIDQGQLQFDYKIKKGISQSFNATILMEQMGIKIGENVE